jgi:N-acetylglucosamine-6-phosphate deacetylase
MRRLSGRIVQPTGVIPGLVEFADRILGIKPGSSTSDDYIIPAFIDLQVNGASWHDGGLRTVNVPEASAAEIRALAARLAIEGTAAFLPTLITAPLDQLERAEREIAAARQAQLAEQPGDEAAIIGTHLEGPFIAECRRGAHPPNTVAPVGEALERVLAMRSLKLVTLAPELPEAMAAIEQLRRRGIVVALGHSDARLETARAAVAAGARMYTHVFNAMRAIAQRDPGIAIAALEPSPALAALIPDGIHVHPAMLAMAVQARSADGILLTTDRRAFGGNSMLSLAEGAVRTSVGALAGSAITMLDGLRVMVEQAGVELGAAVRMAAGNPADLMSMHERGRLEAGARADFLVVDRGLKLKSVILGGREIG